MRSPWLCCLGPPIGTHLPRQPGGGRSPSYHVPEQPGSRVRVLGQVAIALCGRDSVSAGEPPPRHPARPPSPRGGPGKQAAAKDAPAPR